MQNQNFLTIDSGGSKTKLSLYLGERLLKTASVKGFGSAVDSDKVNAELLKTLKDFCLLESPYSVVCNLGGKNKCEFALTLKQAFPNSKIQLFRESEGMAGKVLCEKYRAQMTLMVGTGSIAIAPVGDKIVISGGWGANVSDQGSGYQVGLDAIKNALIELDGIKPLSILTKKLTDMEKPFVLESAEEYCKNRDKVRERLFPLDRANIASFAKIVFECAKLNDKNALSIYQKAGCDLADVVSLAVEKTERPLNKLVVTGGMVNAKEFWAKEFEKALMAKYDLKEVIYIADGIDQAMCEIAKNI